MSKQKISKAKLPKSMEEKYLGKEPKDCILNKIDTTRAYNYFNYFYNAEKAIEFLETYLEKNKETQLLKKFKKFPTNQFPNNIGWLARMQMNGVTITPESEVYFSNFMKKLHDFEVVKKNEQTLTKVVSYENPHIVHLELEHDKVLRNLSGYKFDADLYFKVNTLSLIDLKKVSSYYEPILHELESVSTDEKVKEGYNKYTKKELAALITFYSDIIKNTKDMKIEKARTKVTRKPKPVSIQKKIKKLRFLEKDNNLNISSISSAKVLTSSCIVLYNRERRKLYLCHSPTTFDVNGVSIINIDPEKSFSKTIRKPEMVKVFLDGTKSSVVKKFNEIKAVPAPVERFTTNVDTLLLRVFI